MTDEESRREFLKKAGKFAVYTPPTISLLMHPDVQAIASGGSSIDTDEPNQDDGNTAVDVKPKGDWEDDWFRRRIRRRRRKNRLKRWLKQIREAQNRGRGKIV